MTSRSSPAPNSKSDTQWLHDLGYPAGLHSFKLDYGFSTDDAQDHLDALTLFRQFRSEQQGLWEKRHPSYSYSNSYSNPAKTETETETETNAESKSKSKLVIRDSHTHARTRTSTSIFSLSESEYPDKGEGEGEEEEEEEEEEETHKDIWVEK